ncbi:hypothetical protein QBZ16_001928 [Prototheca wickerhamii]|uniref:HTH myb-type domain-containing protein n=1 Tax=Prototheca wickerhamii TaxID=3111 RepID=A0AAD9IJ77_PROWI|nr:hypothetical protein QBZ16_001928 [Prototheca wickerhamii]
MFVPTRTPTQVASHAQKHFLRAAGVTKRRSRFTAVEAAVLQQQVAGKTPGSHSVGSRASGETASDAGGEGDADSQRRSSSGAAEGGAAPDAAGLLPSESLASMPRYPNGIVILPTTPGRIKVTFTFDPPSAEGRPGEGGSLGARLAALSGEATPGTSGSPGPAKLAGRGNSPGLATLGALSLQLQGAPIVDTRAVGKTEAGPGDAARAPEQADKPADGEGGRADPLAALAGVAAAALSSKPAGGAVAEAGSAEQPR